MSNHESKQEVTQQSEGSTPEASSDHAPRQRAPAYRVALGNALLIENRNGIEVCRCTNAGTALTVCRMLNYAQTAAQVAAGLGGF